MAPTGYSPRLELEKNGSHIFSEPCYSVVVHCTHTHRGSFDKPTFHDPFAAIITYSQSVAFGDYLRGLPAGASLRSATPPRRSLRSPTPPHRSLRSPTSPHCSLRSPPPPPLGLSWRSDPGLWPQIASDGLEVWRSDHFSNWLKSPSDLLPVSQWPIPPISRHFRSISGNTIAYRGHIRSLPVKFRYLLTSRSYLRPLPVCDLGRPQRSLRSTI